MWVPLLLSTLWCVYIALGWLHRFKLCSRQVLISMIAYGTLPTRGRHKADLFNHNPLPSFNFTTTLNSLDMHCLTRTFMQSRQPHSSYSRLHPRASKGGAALTRPGVRWCELASEGCDDNTQTVSVCHAGAYEYIYIPTSHQGPGMRANQRAVASTHRRCDTMGYACATSHVLRAFVCNAIFVSHCPPYHVFNVHSGQ